MNKIKLLALSALMGLACASCDDVLVDNVNPDAAHANTAELGLPVVVFYASQVNYDHAEYYVYLSQCLTTMSKATKGTYPYKEGWEFLSTNRHPQWRRHFYDIGVNANELIKNSQEMGSPNFELIARTIKLMSTQLTTDAWGDMPRSEAYQSNSPKYDTQASIYEWMFQECEDLLEMYNDQSIVNNPGNLAITSKMDRVYTGDLNKWKGLVLAMKARLLLRNVPNVDRSPAMLNKIDAAAQAAIDCWRSGDLLYGSWFGNEPRYYYVEENAVGESACVWSEAQPIINSWESRANMLSSAVPSKFFMVDCLGLINPGIEKREGVYDRENGFGTDPRLSLLFVPQEGPTSPSIDKKIVAMRYLENNIGAGSTYKQANFPKLYAGAYAASTGCYNPIFTMEELYFIKAEAQYWLGNKTAACELAKEATRWNIQRHLDRYLQDNDGLYPSTDNLPPRVDAAESTQKKFEDRMTAFFENETVGRVKACTEIGNKHYFFDASNYTLSDLMIQKYISMYLLPEQWTDLRRYHYSNRRNGYGIGDNSEIVYGTLRRPYNLYAAYWIDGLTTEEQENAWVQRLNYDPETEEKYNAGELERLGAAKNPQWLRKPMIWSEAYGVRTSLTAE